MRWFLLFLCLTAVTVSADPAGQAKSGKYRKGVTVTGGNKLDKQGVSALDFVAQPDCERVVVRFTDEKGQPARRVPTFTAVPAADGKTVDVTFTGVSRFAAVPPKPAADRLVTALAKQAENKLRISLRNPTPYEVYELNYPARLVFDFQKPVKPAPGAVKVPFPVAKVPAGMQLKLLSSGEGDAYLWMRADASVHVFLPAGKPDAATLRKSTNQMVTINKWKLTPGNVWKPKWADAALGYLDGKRTGVIFLGKIAGRPARVMTSGLKPNFLDEFKPMLESF